MTQLKNVPIALITGSSRGLGRSMAVHLANRGVDVIVTYRSSEREAAELVSELESKARKAIALRLDVGDASTFSGFAREVAHALSRVWGRERFDYLVNNAGLGAHASLADTTEAQFDELVRVHLKGPLFLTQRLLPLIADGGRILNVSSGLSRFTVPGYGAYAAMKGGLEVLTRYMAKELGARKIRVNTLAPGAIETDFNGGAVRDNRELNAALAAQTALGRVGLPDDIGAAAAVLLSPDSHWMTGQRVEFSGGMML